MSELQPFPDVDPDAITGAGQQYLQASTRLVTAGSTVQTVAGTTAWTSQSARPAWDNALAARRADISDAQEVTEHVGNVLRTTGAELSRLKSDYESAIFMMLLNPDPRQGHVRDVGGGMMVPDGEPVDPQALAQYTAQVNKANAAVDDAEYALALCARELLSASAGVSFEPLPTGDPAAAVDPQSFAIIPFAPAFGAPSGAVFANGVPVQFPAGKAFEAQMLRILGISGDAKQFFRPDAQGNYNLPRTPSGRLMRGTFPDSMRAGLLEIKSGTTEITMKVPQLQVQQFIARQLGVRWNLIVDENTQVDDSVLDALQRTGGAAYRRIPGQDSIFREVRSGQLMRLQGGGGITADDLTTQPLTPAEVEAVARAERLARGDLQLDGQDPAGSQGPAEPYATEQEFNDQWADAEVGPDGDTPLPGAPTDEGPGEPLMPGGPLETPIEPIEPIIPIGPEDFIP